MQSYISKILKEVYIKRPVLEQILLENGQKTLFDYSKSFAETHVLVESNRKKEFISALSAETSRVLGEEVGERVRKQLDMSYFVSTADHHGPLGHPFFFNTNKLAGVTGHFSHTTHLTDWIVLACSSISLNNSSYPKGLQFHSKEGSALKLNSFSFFPWSLRHAPVYNLPGYEKSVSLKFKDNICKVLDDSVNKKNIQTLTDLYCDSEVINLKSYSDQITLTNYRVFKHFFSPKEKPLNLIYINLEKLTVNLLKNHLQAKTEINLILFNSEYRTKLLNLFEGIPGAFSLKEGKGSFLFWGYDEQKQIRIRLVEKNGYLESINENFKIYLDPESINIALENGTLVPTMLLNLLVVAGYYGVKCLGGFSQTSYLTQMLESYKKIFPEAVVEDSKTLCGDFIFADIVAEGSKAFAITGLDMLLYKEKFNHELFENLYKTKTLNQTMFRIIPILHKILYPYEKECNWPLDAYSADFSIDSTYTNPVIKL